MNTNFLERCLISNCFAVPGWITTEFPEQQVPVRAYIKGVSSGRGQIPQHSYEHYYDFMDFETTLSDLTVFEVSSIWFTVGA